MEELGKALQTLFGKLGDFFDIFDLSFFVGGVATTGALLAWGYFREADIPTNLHAAVPEIVIAILVCYINGLVSFAAGRWLRKAVWYPLLAGVFRVKNAGGNFQEHFHATLSSHQLEQLPFVQAYLSQKNPETAWRLYIRLWAELRQRPELAPSMALLKKYWILAATYDGLATALLIWLLALADLTFGVFGETLFHWYTGVSIGLFVALLVYICQREAGRYVKYQIEDIVASLATLPNQN